MLLPAGIVVLILACAESHGALQPNNYPQALGVRRAYGQQLLQGDPAEELRSGQRLLGLTYPERGASYLGVGADGAAEVAFRLDLSLFMQKLKMLPELQQVVNILVQKVDTFIYNFQGQGGQGCNAEIMALEQSILARIDQQDTKISALYQLVRVFQGDLAAVNRDINQILAALPSLARGMDPGGDCGPQTAAIERLILQMMNTLTQISEMIQRLGLGGASTSILDIVQVNFRLLQQITTLVEQIGAQVGQPVTCPPAGGSITEIQILQEISSVVTLVERVPQQVLFVLQNSGIMGGQTVAVVQYMQQIIQISESVKNEITVVSNVLADTTQELRGYFAESQQSLVAVKRVITETTEIVQSSAAAAISASRNLKCLSKNQKLDLED